MEGRDDAASACGGRSAAVQQYLDALHTNQSRSSPENDHHESTGRRAASTCRTPSQSVAAHCLRCPDHHEGRTRTDIGLRPRHRRIPQSSARPAGPQAAMPRVGSPIVDSACTGLTSGCARPLIWYPLGALCQRDSALNEPQRRGAPTDGSRKTCLSAVGGRRKSLRGTRVSRAPAIHAAWRRGAVAHGADRQLRPAPLRPLVETRHSFVCSRRPSTRDRRLFCLV